MNFTIDTSAPTLATLSISNLETPLTLTASGTVSDDFDVNIVANSFS
jgi:hypothetical protein